jgi:electron transport complex protein RnfB
VTFIATVLLVPALLLLAGLALRTAGQRLRADDATLLEAVEAALPQTQCAQCGYPGCRPYAEALIAGAPLDLCPPGGARTQEALAGILGRPAGRRLPTPAPARAVIDEERCIGCYLCIEACPVDAIVGARQFVHTVLEDRCTGCELCIEPCPVDCIDLVPLTERGSAPAAEPVVLATDGCIRCGRCREVCPEALLPDQLWWRSRDAAAASRQDAELDACIECGLCDPVCPSELELVDTFRRAKAARAEALALQAEADRARKLFEERQARLEREAARAQARRRERLSSGQRRW